MAKVWVLDTETKGTGAEMVPLEKVQKAPPRKPRRRRPPSRPAKAAPSPAPRPERFKVVDVMTRRPLIEGADARQAVAALAGVRSLVDVTIHAWDERAGRWQRLSRDEERMLWRMRPR